MIYIVVIFTEFQLKFREKMLQGDLQILLFFMLLFCIRQLNTFWVSGALPLRRVMKIWQWLLGWFWFTMHFKLCLFNSEILQHFLVGVNHHVVYKTQFLFQREESCFISTGQSREYGGFLGGRPEIVLWISILTFYFVSSWGQFLLNIKFVQHQISY